MREVFSHSSFQGRGKLATKDPRLTNTMNNNSRVSTEERLFRKEDATDTGAEVEGIDNGLCNQVLRVGGADVGY